LTRGPNFLRSESSSVPGVYVNSNNHTALQNYGVLLKQPRKLGLKIVTISFIYVSGETLDDLVTFGWWRLF